MTTYQTIQKERTQAALNKIIEAAQHPICFIDLAEATGFNSSHVRTLIKRHPEQFKSFGVLKMDGRKAQNYFQALSSEELVSTLEKQAFYLNPYDQLCGAVQYV